jgi:hypothetical protein
MELIVPDGSIASGLHSPDAVRVVTRQLGEKSFDPGHYAPFHDPPMTASCPATC